MSEVKTYLSIEIIIITVLIIILGMVAYQRNSVWKDDLTLWRDTVTKSPNKARPHNYMGISYKNRGLLDKAIEHYQISIRSAPAYSEPYNNLGVCYFEKGGIDSAIQAFREAISINYKNAEAHYNLGIAYGSKGLYEQAFMEIKKGKELSTEGNWVSILGEMKSKEGRHQQSTGP
ncbi:MAG: tetratricopeptide repeat protein [Thermodesulfobacteriota bacterium]